MVQTSFHVLMNHTACVRVFSGGAPIASHGHKSQRVVQRGRGLKWP